MESTSSVGVNGLFFMSRNTARMTFFKDGFAQNLFFIGRSVCLLSMDCHFDTGTYLSHLREFFLLKNVLFVHITHIPINFTRFELFSYQKFNDTPLFMKYIMCVCLCVVLFTNPSARAGYDTRSIFKRSLIGLNSEFSFS